MAVLKIDNIHKSYGSTKALNGVSFEVPKGSIFGILGPNGGGKTTLLGIILDVLKADSGDFIWFEKPHLNGQRKQIGTLLETPNFYHYLSATRNLEITQRISERGSAKDIEDVLKKVNLYDRRKSRFSTYSLGMKQRLSIAATLLGAPSVLVLDEPTNGLDPVGIAEIRQLIKELNEKGHTIIMASHLLDEVEKICTHVAIMRKGEVLTCGKVDEILANEDQVEIGSKNRDSLLLHLKGFPGLIRFSSENKEILLTLPKDTADLETINEFFFKKGVALNHLFLRRQKLEARFFELTQN